MMATSHFVSFQRVVRAPRPNVRSVAVRYKMDRGFPAKVQEVLAQQTGKLFIGGEYVDSVSGKTYENTSPMTAESMGTVAEGDAADIDVAVQAARTAFDSGPWTSMSARERGRLMYKFADLLEEHAEELAILESADNGKPLTVARAADIPVSIDHFRYFAGWADKIHGKTIPSGDGTLCMTLREPVGVVGAIIPWNFPLAMLAWKVAPALAAGCTVVVKCAEQTPLTALRAAELAARAGIPPGVFNVVPGYGPTAGAALATHPDVDKIGFTGSTEIGKLIMKAAADRVTNISLELGGKSPLIVCEDADVEKAAQVAHVGLFFNAAQCCCASSRVYVHAAVYDAFVKRSVELANGIKVGNSFDDSTNQGPQVDSEQFDKYLRYVKIGQEQGAKLMCGGRAAAERGYFVQPTVFADVTDDMDIAVDEIFGPVMSCMKFTDLDDVLRRANDSDFGLAAGVCSQNVDTVNKVTRALRAGTVWVNTWNTFDAAAPFGGYRQSGIHRDKGEEALDNYLETKTIISPQP